MMTVVVRLNRFGHVLTCHVGVEVKLLDLSCAVLDGIRQFKYLLSLIRTFLVFLFFAIHFGIVFLLLVFCISLGRR